MALDDAVMLPCGRDAVAVAERGLAGPGDDHERTCPHCQSVIRDAGLVRRAALELAAQPVQVPPTLLPKIVRAVWAELRQSARIPLRGSGADAEVTALAVADLLRHELDGPDALTVHSCRVEAVDDPASNGGMAALAVRLTASAKYPADLRRLADRARRTVSESVGEQLGLGTAGIDIEFIDIDLPEGPW